MKGGFDPVSLCLFKLGGDCKGSGQRCVMGKVTTVQSLKVWDGGEVEGRRAQ